MKKNVEVLFLDDEINILKAIQRELMDAPFDTAVTTVPEEALQILEKENIKVVCSDQRMPSMSGIDFLTRAREKKPDTVRILLTGYADVQAAEDAINLCQVYRFLQKPWDSRELKATLEQAIHHFDLVEENRNLFELTKAKIRELELTNRKFKTMYQAQRDFTNTVSHELKSPLSSVKTAIDIILSKTAGPLTEQQDKFLGQAKGSVERLQRLINDILDLSRLTSAKQVLHLEYGQINQILHEVVENHRPLAQKNGLKLIGEFDQTVPEVPLNPDKIRQLLINLTDNAVKFTPAGGQVTLISRHKPEGNHIEIEIRDTGCGIKSDDIPKLFHAFQQLDLPEQKRAEGTGLGLTICKEIIDRHCGKIWVTSQEGKGSSFFFVLPIHERRKN